MWEGTLELILFHLPCHAQERHPLEQVAQGLN